MRFYKQVWGIIWEFNSMAEYACFVIGRIIGCIIFFFSMYLLATYDSFDQLTFSSVMRSGQEFFGGIYKILSELSDIWSH